MAVLRLFAAISVISAVLTPRSPAQAQTPPPKAEVRNVVDEYFNQKITDPYRWPEDLKSQQTQRWIKAQADYSRAYFDNLPPRRDILARLNGFNSAGPVVSDVRARQPVLLPEAQPGRARQ